MAVATPAAPPGTVAPLHEDPTIHARRWGILAMLCTSLVIVVVGNTTLNVAIPTLANPVKGLGASTTELQWIVDAYSLVFAGLLLSAGALGDRFGRKGALQLGLLTFGIASAASATSVLTPSASALIGWRALMGVGAALIMPATLSILTNVFPPQERAKAIAIWAGLSGAGAGLGPVASGLLLNHFSWHSVFLVNVPLIVGALIVGKFIIPRSSDPNHGKLDPVGAVLSAIGIVTLVYGIIEAPDHGWAAPSTLLAFAVAAGVLVGFGAWELRTEHPMLDLRFFKNPRFGVASGVVTLVFFAMFGMFFLLTQYFQLVLGYSPLSAGLRQLPVAFVLMAVAPNSARFVARFGVRKVVAAGLGLVAIGQLSMSFATVDTPYFKIVVAMAVLASGMGLTVSPMTASIMGSVPLGKAGVGSAVNDTTRELGGALGVAVLGSLLAGRYKSSLASSKALEALGSVNPKLHELATASLGGAKQVAAQGAGQAGVQQVFDDARHAYVNGMHVALIVGASIALIAALIVLRFFPRHVMAVGNPAAAQAQDVPNPVADAGALPA